MTSPWFAGVMRDIDLIADEYLENVKTMSEEERKKKLTEINVLFGKSTEYGDDKVQLASQTYEMVSGALHQTG